PEVFAYQVYLDKLTDIEISAIPTHKAATVVGTGVKTLSTGENKFYIVVIAEDGVTKNTYSIVVILDPVGISEAGDAAIITLYPNPVKNILHVEVKNKQAADVAMQIYNLSGDMILSDKFDTTSFQVDLSGCPAGVLVVKIINGNDVVVKRLVKLE
ncbi:T9SS type A sorting domain-containing protein, partial [Bacteroides sp. OttesenSCG-928-E20]|nr:T9SS type A sorting domain-containing protein [Bacteroides sp. OttesenSCG-928-E20]